LNNEKEEWFIVHDGFDYKAKSNFRHIIGPFDTSGEAYSFHACEMGVRNRTSFIVLKEDLPVTQTFTRYEYFDFVCKECGIGYMKGHGVNADEVVVIDGDPIVMEPMCKPCKLSEMKELRNFYKNLSDGSLSNRALETIDATCVDLINQIESGSYFGEVITS
tara:strand:- start:64 stop:549 length:486 start_codon:yes stop_codon:yes gene_type:complete